MQALGIELAEIAPGRCVLVAAQRAKPLQQHGYFHGAVLGAMLDCAGGYAAYSLMPPDSEVLTAEYKVNFVAAAEGERLIARGKVVKPGRTLTLATAEGICLQGGAERLCAVMLQSLVRVPAEPAPAKPRAAGGAAAIPAHPASPMAPA
ncbi:MAG TPA: PaaI family thioesterase [Geminicoccaceae bacterium]|nr:PaaI family thioesterase [Geminicoccaceae bacterium]